MHLNHIIKTPETFTYLPGPTEQAVVYVGDYSVVASIQLQPGWELPAGSAVTEKAHVFHIPAFGPMNHPLTAARDLVGGWQVTYEHETYALEEFEAEVDAQLTGDGEYSQWNVDLKEALQGQTKGLVKYLYWLSREFQDAPASQFVEAQFTRFMDDPVFADLVLQIEESHRVWGPRDSK